MKKAPRERQQKEKLPPRLPWQVDDYSRLMCAELVLPYEFLLLCKLVEVPPRSVIGHFISQLAQATPVPEKNNSRMLLLSYFMEMQYGSYFFDPGEIEQLLLQLRTINDLEITGANPELLYVHEQWREKYLHHWYQRWEFMKHRTPANSPG